MKSGSGTFFSGPISGLFVFKVHDFWWFSGPSINPSWHPWEVVMHAIMLLLSLFLPTTRPSHHSWSAPRSSKRRSPSSSPTSPPSPPRPSPTRSCPWRTSPSRWRTAPTTRSSCWCCRGLLRRETRTAWWRSSPRASWRCWGCCRRATATRSGWWRSWRERSGVIYIIMAMRGIPEYITLARTILHASVGQVQYGPSAGNIFWYPPNIRPGNVIIIIYIRHFV